MRRIVPFLYYSRSGRRVVVYGKPEQLHRPNYGGRGDYRVPDSNRAIRAGRHHDRCRWRSMVCSNQRQSNRPDHNGREITEFKLPSGNARPHAITAGVSGIYGLPNGEPIKSDELPAPGTLPSIQSLPLRRTSWHNRGFGRRGLVRRGMRSDRPVYDSVLGLGENILLRP